MTCQPPPHHHLSTEWLSAYLDGVVAPEDRGAGGVESAEAHLRACARCAGELADLDAVRGLLRRLPQVAPPRSFALRQVPERQAPEPRPARIWDLPRLVVWTRAATAVAAAFFVLFLSLDLLGAGVDVPASSALQNRLAVPTAAPAAPKPAAAPDAEARPAQAPAAAQAPMAAPADTAAAGASAPAEGAASGPRVEAAPSTVGSLTATAPTVVGERTPTSQPLRLASILSGVLTLVLLAAALLVGRRAAARHGGGLGGPGG